MSTARATSSRADAGGSKPTSGNTAATTKPHLHQQTTGRTRSDTRAQGESHASADKAGVQGKSPAPVDARHGAPHGHKDDATDSRADPHTPMGARGPGVVGDLTDSSVTAPPATSDATGAKSAEDPATAVAVASETDSDPRATGALRGNGKPQLSGRDSRKTAPAAGNATTRDPAAIAEAATRGSGELQAVNLMELLNGDGTASDATGAGDASGSTEDAGTAVTGGAARNAAGKPDAATLNAAALAASLAMPVPPATTIATTRSGGTTAQDSGLPGGSIGALGKDMGSAAQQLAKLLIETDTRAADASARQGSQDTAVAAAADPAATNTLPPPDNTANAAAALAHLGALQHGGLREVAATTGELRSPLGSQAWNDELGQQLTWMSQQGIDSASLRLSPVHLGPLEVQISVQNGSASVWFGAAHADTRAALERALPQLQQMFASQGLHLADSGVSREPPRNPSRPTSVNGVTAVAATSATGTSSLAVRTSLGLVDTYA